MAMTCDPHQDDAIIIQYTPVQGVGYVTTRISTNNVTNTIAVSLNWNDSHGWIPRSMMTVKPKKRHYRTAGTRGRSYERGEEGLTDGRVLAPDVDSPHRDEQHASQLNEGSSCEHKKGRPLNLLQMRKIRLS